MSRPDRYVGITTMVHTFGFIVAVAYGLTLAVSLPVVMGSEVLSGTALWAFGVLAHRGFTVFCDHHRAIIEHEKCKPRKEPIYWGSLISLAILAIVLVVPLGLRSLFLRVSVRTK